MKTDAQNNQILKYLQTGRSLTPMDALQKFGCFRLGARIYDLRGMNYNILTEKVHANGKRFARYWLVQDKVA